MLQTALHSGHTTVEQSTGKERQWQVVTGLQTERQNVKRKAVVHVINIKNRAIKEYGGVGAQFHPLSTLY
jgi:hypothetical protein